MRCARAARRFSAPTGLVVAAFAVIAVRPAFAQVTQITPTLQGRVTWTNNFSLQPDSERESDLITTITPGLSIDYIGPRSFLRGYVRVPLILYARHSEENQVTPSVALNGRFDVVRDFFFIEAQALVSQTYFSPFGAQPSDIENVTDNSYLSQTYRVTPYIQGRIGSEIEYLLRNDNIWRINTDEPTAAESSLTNSYINRVFGTINRNPTPFGWGADVDRNEYRYSGRDDQLMELARARLVWQPDPQFQVFVSGGYERNKLTLSETSNSIYGGGFRWRPTDRTKVDARVEERFFGTGYDVLLQHRTPRTVWTFTANRNTSDLPEYIGRLPAGVAVPGLLSDLFAGRIQDPAERAQFIAEFIDQRGLPLVLDSPLDIYDPQIDIRETLVASLGLLGARNTVFFSLYRMKTREVDTGEIEFPSPPEARNNNTQTGATAVWSYQLAPSTTMTFSATAARTEASPPFTQVTDRYVTRLLFSRSVTPRTSIFGGARWQTSDSQPDLNDYTEAAVFAGFNHSFR